MWVCKRVEGRERKVRTIGGALKEGEEERFLKG